MGSKRASELAKYMFKKVSRTLFLAKTEQKQNEQEQNDEHSLNDDHCVTDSLSIGPYNHNTSKHLFEVKTHLFFPFHCKTIGLKGFQIHKIPNIFSVYK